VHAEEIGAAICVGERGRERHLALQCGIRRFKLVDFDNLLVWNELHKTAVGSMCDLGVE